MQPSIIVTISLLLFFIIIFKLFYKVKDSDILKIITVSNNKIEELKKIENNDMKQLLNDLKENIKELENFENNKKNHISNDLVEIDLEILIDNVYILLEQIEELKDILIK
jgi:hypothetical protein